MLRLLGRAAAVPPLLLTAACGAPPAGLVPTAAPRFTDVAAATGVATTGPSFAVAAADFDRDGWPDLAVSAHGRVQLFRNLGGRFDDVAPAMGLLPGDTHGLSWIDLDRDGWLDLLVAVGAQRGFGAGDNQIYSNLGGATLRHEREAPEVLRDPFGRGRCLVAVDLDGDGRLDVAVVNLVQEGRWSRLARATADGGYTDAGATLGVARVEAECLTAVHLDPSPTPTLIAYGGGADSGRAFHPGPGGVLVDVTDELRIPRSRHTLHALAAGDYDNDGDLDLYLARGHHVPPALTRLEDGLGFRLAAVQPGRAPSFTFRCTGDVEADLMVGNRRDPALVFLGTRRLHPPANPWVIAGSDPTIQGAPPAAGEPPPGLHAWRAAPGEYTVKLIGDGGRVTAASGIFRGGSCGYELLAASEELRRPPAATPDILLRNAGGRLEDVTAAAGLGDERSGRDALFFDADNDGDLDLFVVNGGVAFGQYLNAFYLNRGDGTFLDVSGSAGIAGPEEGRGATVTALDYDRDGDLDLFVTNGDGPPLGNQGPYSLWRNDTAPQGHWLEVDLVGGADNPLAIGARVLARFGGRRLLVARASSNGRFSTSVLPLHFGLGDATEAEVEVRWPSGRSSRAAARHAERLVLTELSVDGTGR